MLKVYKDNKDKLIELEKTPNKELREKVLEVKQTVYKSGKAFDKGLKEGTDSSIFSFLSIHLGLALQNVWGLLMGAMGAGLLYIGHKTVRECINNRKKYKKEATEEINKLLEGQYPKAKEDSNSTSTKELVEEVKKLQGQAKEVKKEGITAAIFSALYIISGVLFGTNVFKARSEQARYLLAVAWPIIGIVDGILAVHEFERKKDIDSDIILLEEELPAEQKAQLELKK